MSLQPGMQIGDYQVLRELGAGGMGKVYQVRNVISDRVDALKVLLPDLVGDPGLADRFLREIKVQAALDHPNIAGLRTAMREGNQLLMVMEFVEGQTVGEYLHQGPIPPADAARICMDVCLALDYAHQRGIVHRDIKPSNIMITRQGVVKLMDFGIARVMSDPSLTQTHQTTGSLYYMSPEQINGAPLDGRADLYSLAVSLYEMLTARRPFDGENTFAIMAAHMQQMPVPPVQLDPRVPAALSDVILRGLAKDPNQRYQTAGDFRNALGQALQGPAPAPGPQQAQPAHQQAGQMPPPQPRSNRMVYMVAGSLATVGILALAITQGPKFFKTNAQQDPVVEQTSGQPPAQDPPLQTDPEQPPTTSTPEQQAAQTPDPSTPQSAQQQTPPSTAGTPAKREPARPQGTTAVAYQQPAANAVDTRQAQSPVSQASAPPPAAPSAPPQTAPAPAVNSTEVRELRSRVIQMAQRISVANAALQSLRESMASQGLRPRAELSGHAQRMQFEMDQAESALNGNNASSARQHLDYAERALEALERALNL